jgi:DNA-binding CsgD family transcriptional regulator/PAS domain-containing protein
MVVDRQPIGTMIACNQYFPDDYVLRSAFYQEFLVPHEWRFAAGGRVMVAADVTAYVAVHRSPRQGPFQPPELGLLSQLAPHLGRALKLHRELAQIRNVGHALELALNQLALGVIVTDALGRVVALNHSADRILAASDGLELRRGRVAAGRTEGETTLLRLLSQATRGGTRARGGALSVSRPSGRRPYALEVTPLPAWSQACSSWQRPLALFLVTDPEQRPAPLGRRPIDLFGLTPAEARLAVELAKGGRLEDIAAKHGVRMTTVRSQLRALLMKTETHRQSELIGLLTRLPPTAARGGP